MATAILSSQNHQFNHKTLIHRNTNSHHSNASTTAPRRRKRIPTASQSTTTVVSPAAKTNLVMGQVKILKRGETLSEFLKKEEANRCSDGDDKKQSDLKIVVASTNRIEPEPEIVKKQIGDSTGLVNIAVDYAGFVCSVSPPPTSVPIPCFLGKKNKLNG